MPLVCDDQFIFYLRYVVGKYDIEKTRLYSVATVLDPRFKLAGFQKKENGLLAKEMIIR